MGAEVSTSLPNQSQDPALSSASEPSRSALEGALQEATTNVPAAGGPSTLGEIRLKVDMAYCPRQPTGAPQRNSGCGAWLQVLAAVATIASVILTAFR